jgi:hypothetical protein
VDELGVDKVLALFGRAEARDFVDLFAVLEDNDLAKLLRLAAEKDRGFDPTVFAGMLARFDRLPREAFSLDDDSFDELESTIVRWHEVAVASGRHLTRGSTRDAGRGSELGL